MLTFKQFLKEYLSDQEKQSIQHWDRPDHVSQQTDHFFGKGNDEIETPLSIPKSDIHKEVEHHLGQEISKEDYSKGMINNRIRIQSSISDPDLQRRYKSDPTRTMKSGTALGTVLVTRSKHGIAGQTSTGQSWIDHSCKRFGKGVANQEAGQFSHFLQSEYETGTVVAYHKDKNGKEISRTTLHPYHNGDKVVYKANGNYGDRSPAFNTFVKNLELQLSHPYDEKDSGRKYTLNPNVSYDDNQYILPGSESKDSTVTLHPQDLINNRDKLSKQLEDKINTNKYTLSDIAHGYLNGYLTQPTLKAIHKKIGEEFSSSNLDNILKYHKMGLITKDHRKILADGLQKKLDKKTLTSSDIFSAQKYGYFAPHLHAPIKNYMIDKFSVGDINSNNRQQYKSDDQIYLSQLNSEDRKILKDKISEKLLNGDDVDIRNLYHNGFLFPHHIKEYISGFPKKLSSGNFNMHTILIDAMNGIHDHSSSEDIEIIPPHWNNSMIDEARKGLGQSLLKSNSFDELLSHARLAKELGYYDPIKHDHYLDKAISSSSFYPDEDNYDFKKYNESFVNELLKNKSINISSIHNAISNYIKNNPIKDLSFVTNANKYNDLSHPFFSKEIHEPIIQQQIRSALEHGNFSASSIDELIKNGHFGDLEKISASKGLIHQLINKHSSQIKHAIENGYFDPKLHFPAIKSNMKNYDDPEEFSSAYDLLKNSPNFKKDISNIAAERLKLLSKKYFVNADPINNIINSIDHAMQNNYINQNLRNIAKNIINNTVENLNVSNVGHIINTNLLSHAKVNNYIDKQSLIKHISKNSNYNLSPVLLSIAKEYGELHKNDENNLLHAILKNHLLSNPSEINPTYIHEAKEKGFWSDELKKLANEWFTRTIKEAPLDDRNLDTLINNAKHNNYFNQKKFAEAIKDNIKSYGRYNNDGQLTRSDNKDILRFISKHNLYDPYYNNIINSVLEHGNVDLNSVLKLSQSPHLHKIIADYVGSKKQEPYLLNNMKHIEPLLNQYGIHIRPHDYSSLYKDEEGMKTALEQFKDKISKRFFEPSSSGNIKKKVIPKPYLERPYPTITARQRRMGIVESKNN